jgi:NAD(P)-dependent dehydrogenase (short-subunit alcohol dehydrogenase family)
VSDQTAGPALHGKVAIVTGAGSGIGRATAIALAGQGASVVANDIVPEYLDELLEEIPHRGRHATVVGDIALETTSEQLAATAMDRFGRLDILISNVGRMFFKDITDVTVAEYDELMGVNVRGMFLACKHSIPLLMAAGGGSIVIVSSGSAFVGQEFGTASTFLYNISKAAVRQLATSLGTRYARDGIRVNAIAPGVTRTNQIRHYLPDLTQEQEDAIFAGATQAVPLGRVASPSEIANAILFLVSDSASYVVASTLIADGGYLAR